QDRGQGDRLRSPGQLRGRRADEAGDGRCPRAHRQRGGRRAHRPAREGRGMIRRLTLSNWRAYDRLDLTFEEGVTFLVAANGVGKSSIVMAAAWGLLGEASAVDAVSCVRGDADQATVALELQLPAGKRLDIERSVTARGRTQSQGPLEAEPGTDLPTA